MSGFTLQQVFGTNAIQDEDTITIAKSDLSASSGFTATDENDGESILVALLLQAQSLGLDVASRDGDGSTGPDISQQVAINEPITTLVERVDPLGNAFQFKRDSFLIDLDVAVEPINPNYY